MIRKPQRIAILEDILIIFTKYRGENMKQKLLLNTIERNKYYDLSTQDLVDDFLNNKYDPMDYIVVDNLFRQENVIFISDDIDFQYDTRINVITA
jgi:hypothetical protein